MRDRSIARNPSSYARYEFAASVRKGSATGVNIRARNSFTRSDPARDFFFRLFALDQLFEDQRLSRSGGDRLRLGYIERSAQRERRLRHRSNEWRFAGRHHRQLFLPPARLAFLGIAKFLVQDENRRRDLFVQLERRAHV